MALHTGEADERGGDYFGPALNRVARLLAIGHGGQVLVSSAAEAGIHGALAAEASLRDWGSHRLKDLQEPEHVYQLCAPDLPAEFPTLRSLQAFANNLPVQATSFIGREEDININTAHPEFRAWKWADPAELPAMIVPFKRKLYQDVLAAFRPWLKG